MKKIIAIILVAASLSALHIDTFAEEHSYDTRAETVLEAVGLDTSFSTGASISRGRFVAAIADFMGLGHSDQTPFYDVGTGSEYFGQICAAYMAGLISGKADKMFYPNENITYNEAISICITATGRKMYAVAHGGYPVGFNYTADSEELGKNVAARGDTPISGEDAVWLLFNTFSCEIIGQESFGADIELAGSGETMFSFYKDIEVTEGIVKANRLSGLYSAEDMLADRAKIGDLVMGDENGLCDELLGLYVEVYYTENDSEQSEIKACFPVEKENSITEIDAADCISFEDNIFTYEIHGRQKKERIDASVPVIYNRTAA
ncbi:MAG: S-layer homology domain-containing protein, partial [Clostridia bacterium]|nr:S-layer homology domain-containing protein [Clostridia bacterium]